MDIRKCPACGYENSPKGYKCYECGKMFYTNEELAAMFPPGRGGFDWFEYWDKDGIKHDPAVEYAKDIGVAWTPDPKCGSPFGFIAPDGTFWPVSWQQHHSIAPALVAKFNLWGKPSFSNKDGIGGSVTRDEFGRMYYDPIPSYPHSEDILRENGWLTVGMGFNHPTIWGTDEPTVAQRNTIERWRKKHKVKYIEHYDPWENRPREGENDAKINE